MCDSNGNLPVHLTTDKNITKLIGKYDKPRKSEDKLKKKSPQLKPDDILFQKFGLSKKIPYRPPKPPKAIGYLEKMGTFIFNYNRRFLEVDPIVGSFRRFKNLEDYPNIPKYFYFKFLVKQLI